MSLYSGILGDVLRGIVSNKWYGDKKTFIENTRKGDILIISGGLVERSPGHAAIMATNNWVVEMPGENKGQSLRDNNRRISKDAWFDLNAERSLRMTVYRCRDNSVAIMAADWAYKHYYNSSGGEEKNIHIRYSIVSPIFEVRDPSYCSKVVLQAYHYGTGDAQVVSPLILTANSVAIPPSSIPSYFTSSYALKVVIGQPV